MALLAPRWLSLALALMLAPSVVSAKPRKPPPPPVTPADSVGHPNDGKLVGGVRLDTSPKYLRVVPAYRRADTRWGLPSLVAMIDRAGRVVAKRYPGAVLSVGDLSRRG